MRRVVVFAVAVGALLAAAPAWGAAITLKSDHRVARYDDSVRFKGTVAAPDPQPVLLLRDGVVVASTATGGGAFVFDLRARRAGRFVARSSVGDSSAVVLRVKPRLRSRVVGTRRIGHRLFVVGRLLPARSGRLVLRFRGSSGSGARRCGRALPRSRSRVVGAERDRAGRAPTVARVCHGLAAGPAAARVSEPGDGVARAVGARAQAAALGAPFCATRDRRGLRLPHLRGGARFPEGSRAVAHRPGGSRPSGGRCGGCRRRVPGSRAATTSRSTSPGRS